MYFTLFTPEIVVLVGPSGSGKSEVCKMLLEKSDKFAKLKSYTTNDPTSDGKDNWYNYVSKKAFFEMMETGQLFESTMYAGHGYGSKKSDVEDIISKGKIPLAAMDICGAMSLKTNFKNVATVYLKCDKRDLLRSLLMKKCSIEDKVNRIISIDDERRNEEICDYVAEYITPEITADEIIKMLNIK